MRIVHRPNESRSEYPLCHESPLKAVVAVGFGCDLGGVAKDGDAAVGDKLEGLGEGEAFLFEDAGGELFGGVGVVGWASALKDDGAGVVGLIGKVDGASGDLAAVFEDGGVDVLAVHALSAKCGE